MNSINTDKVIHVKLQSIESVLNKCACTKLSARESIEAQDSLWSKDTDNLDSLTVLNHSSDHLSISDLLGAY